MESAIAHSPNPPFRPFPTGRQALDLAKAGLQGLDRIGEHWGLTVDQQRILLGSLPRTTYYAILNGTARTVSADTLERLSLLMGIWGHLEILIPNPQASLGWMRRPHPDHRFGDHSPLAWILQGTVAALADLRRHLEAWRFGR
jgi:hypothetical protein